MWTVSPAVSDRQAHHTDETPCLHGKQHSSVIACLQFTRTHPLVISMVTRCLSRFANSCVLFELEQCKVDIGAGSNNHERRHGGMELTVLLKPQVTYDERPEHDGFQSPWRRDAMDDGSTSQAGIQK